MMRSARFPAVVLSLLLCSSAAAEPTERFRAWNRPVEPFRIAGGLYYVGTSELAAYLLVTPEGHVLLDGGFAETAPLVRASIETLGFRIEDVRILINSHAHSDHAGGLAALKAASGARLVAGRGDAPLLRSGDAGSPFPFPPVEPDRVIDDGDTVALGGTTLTARVTPGHTPGCTTWTTRLGVGDAARDVVFLCSVNALPEMDLIAPDPAYPQGRAAAFRRSFEILESLPCDVFLGAHASFFLMEEKRARLEADPEAFVDPALYRRHLAAKKRAFEQRLAEGAP